MKNIYIVKHYHCNPAHNTSYETSNLVDAVRECRIYCSDSDNGQCSKIYKNGEYVGRHIWTKKNINWFKLNH